MPHQGSPFSASLQLTPESSSERKQFRSGRTIPIPVRLPGDPNRASFHASPAKSSVASTSSTMQKARNKPLDPFGRSFCETSKSRGPSSFVATHIGVPCTQGALDHQLDCGHKISTDQPERCASNCQQSATSTSHPASDTEPFVCVSCIVDEVKAKHDAKVESFQREMEAIASAARKDLERDEIARRLQIIEIGWRELDLKDMRERIACGRWSQPFYVDPAYGEAVCLLADEQSVSTTMEKRSSRSTCSIKARSELSVASAPSSRAHHRQLRHPQHPRAKEEPRDCPSDIRIDCSEQKK